MERIQAVGLRCAVLEELRDVDTLEDLEHYALDRWSLRQS
jgi:hypothetical protein